MVSGALPCSLCRKLWTTGFWVQGSGQQLFTFGVPNTKPILASFPQAYPDCAQGLHYWTTLFWNQGGHGIRTGECAEDGRGKCAEQGAWVLGHSAEPLNGLQGHSASTGHYTHKKNLLSLSQSHCEGFVVQPLSHVQLFAISWTAACHASLSFTISQSLIKIMFTESVMPSNYVILCHPLLLLPSIFPSIRVFSSELALRIRWPKYWSFSFSISPSMNIQGWFSLGLIDLLAVQGTLKSLLQHHSWKASIFHHSAFFMVQLSHQYMDY